MAVGEEVLTNLLELVKQLLKPILAFVVAFAKILYPPLIVIGVVLWAIGERWLAWRFLSTGVLTGIIVELVLPALGLI